MDVLTLLSQAKVKDGDGVELGDVTGIHFVDGKMEVTINFSLFDDDDEEDDPDDPEKEDIPEDDASKTQFPRIVSAKGKRTGTDG